MSSTTTDSIPRVSIGLPVYNGENFLADALDALLAQTFEDFEIIISDNASTDRTAGICQEYAARDPRIRYVRNTENIGAARNYNHTFELARAPLFKWAAHDDFCKPTFLERCVAVLDREPEVVVAYTKTIYLNAQKQILRHYDKSMHLRQPTPHQRLHGFYRATGECDPVFGVIRTDVLRRTPLIASFISSDRTLLAELLMYGHFYEVQEELFLRMWHEGMRKKYKTLQSYAVWFDPLNVGRTVFQQRWAYISGMFRAFHHAPLPLREKLRCDWVYATYYLESQVKRLLKMPGKIYHRLIPVPQD